MDNDDGRRPKMAPEMPHLGKYFIQIGKPILKYGTLSN
jgi:hypothetical protein